MTNKRIGMKMEKNIQSMIKAYRGKFLQKEENNKIP